MHTRKHSRTPPRDTDALAKTVEPESGYGGVGRGARGGREGGEKRRRRYETTMSEVEYRALSPINRMYYPDENTTRKARLLGRCRMLRKRRRRRVRTSGRRREHTAYRNESRECDTAGLALAKRG